MRFWLNEAVKLLELWFNGREPARIAALFDCTAVETDGERGDGIVIGLGVLPTEFWNPYWQVCGETPMPVWSYGEFAEEPLRDVGFLAILRTPVLVGTALDGFGRIRTFL